MNDILRRTLHLASLVTLLFCAIDLESPRRAAAQPAPSDHTVLVLGGTVTGGVNSIEVQMALAMGMDIEIVGEEGWLAKSASDFASYRALVLGDPSCIEGVSPSVTAAASNRSVWGPVVNGHVVLIGTDEVFHDSQGGNLLSEKAMAFAVSEPGRTGLFCSLSCYYHGTAAHTPVPLLEGLGAGPFTVTGVGCSNDVHIVATSPALTGLTDASLSNWNCSVQEAFDTWPLTFEVLALARGIGTSFTAPDGSVGTPYILARGVQVISDIHLEPIEATNPVGTRHALTATLISNGSPVPGLVVTFLVVSGPHLGVTGTATSGADGKANFSYAGTTVGTDLIQATATVSGRPQRSNRVTKTWTPGGGDTEPPVITCPGDIRVACEGGEGAIVTFTVSATDNLDPSPQIVCVPASGSRFHAGSTTVVCTATDRSGNSSHCEFQVVVSGAACPLGQGYWKNHLAAWPVAELPLGVPVYDQPALVGLLAQPVRGDASLILAKQLIAAKLNLARCAGAPGVADEISRADALIGARSLPAGVAPRTRDGQLMLALAERLEAFDAGERSPGCGAKASASVEPEGAELEGWIEGGPRLIQGLPNPFGLSTDILFTLPRAAGARLSILDLQGRIVRVLVDGSVSAGPHTVTWDGADASGHAMPSGVYLYLLEAEGTRSIRRIVRMD